MLLIVSGAYVETELFSEFGRIPPCFLPVGNKRLYAYQIERFGEFYDTIHLTIPDDFELDEADDLYLRRNGIHVYRTKAGILLGEAVRDYLAATVIDGQMDILYGDTLIGDDRLDGTDWVAVGRSDEYYHWHHEVPGDGHGGGTWAGMFSFSNARLLHQKLSEVSDFISAVTRYGESVGKMERKPVERWLDFGHVHTYFDSKRTITTQRHFNQLSIVDGILTKSSSDTRKILAEATWFETAPPRIKVFLPNFISKQECEPVSYSLEYLTLATLNELYVFGRLPPRVWKKILSSCDSYFHAASLFSSTSTLPANFLEVTYLRKTLDRLDKFSAQAKVDLEAPWIFNGVRAPSLHAIAEEASRAVMSSAAVPSFIHGDFCFSNILFDFRSGRLKIVDPRGIDAEGRITPYGDFRYEIGKLAHSVLGLYDFIVAGQYSLNVEKASIRFKVLADRSAFIQDIFHETEFMGKTPKEWDCYPVMLLLFLSMLPLHVDDPCRQEALMANCLRLYLKWKHDNHTDGG